MTKPRALVVSGYGLNCEEETAFGLERGGSNAEIVHINDLIDASAKLDDVQILVIPGGFSYGDDTGSGNAFANRLRNHLWDEILRFIERDTLTLGICNGFQILTNLGLLPAFGTRYGERTIALLPNNSARYTARWVDVEIVNQTTPFFRGIERMALPVAHGEGRLFAHESTLRQLRDNHQLGARYVAGEICDYLQLPNDPNGSSKGIASICDPTGRVLGMMPHPERAIFATQLPHWHNLKETIGLETVDAPGPGLQVFKNISAYFN